MWAARIGHTYTPSFNWPCNEASLFVSHARVLPWADSSAFTLTALMLAGKSRILHMPEFIVFMPSLLSQVPAVWFSYPLTGRADPVSPTASMGNA